MVARDWKSHLIEDDEGIRRILQDTRRIAVLGIKMEASQPAHYVPAYSQRIGLTIVRKQMQKAFG